MTEDIIGRLAVMAHCMEIGMCVPEVIPGAGYQWTIADVVALLDDAKDEIKNLRQTQR